MQRINAKRIWLISDTHLGVRSNSREWMDIIEDYFRNFFIPLLEKEGKPGDVVVHCGDVFDSRQSINLYVLNKGISIFEDIAKIMPIYMIIGNHDIFMKYTNEINSLKVFRNVENITVFEEPTHMMFSDKKMFFLPWVEKHEEIKEIIKDPKNASDVLFCHTDIRGLSFNRFTKIEEGTEAEVFKGHKRVYSGHIHYAQKTNNIRMLGCPYELTRSDIGNQKSVWLYDLETDTETQFKNDYSPRFLRYKLEWILEQTLEDLQATFQNNFIDIMVTPQWSLKFPFSAFTEKFSGYRKINHNIVTEEEQKVEDGEELAEGESGEINLTSLIEKHIEGLHYSDAIKEKLISVSKKLYQEALRELEEKRSHENQNN